jgi:hypothetical protein
MLTGESDGHMSTVCDGEEKGSSDDEQFWRTHMPWLEAQGYIPVQAVGGASWGKQPTRKDLFQSVCFLVLREECGLTICLLVAQDIEGSSNHGQQALHPAPHVLPLSIKSM